MPGAGRGLVGTRVHNFVNFCALTEIFHPKVELDEIYQIWVKKVPKNFEIPIVYRTIGQKIGKTKRFLLNNRNFLNFDYFGDFFVLKSVE